MQPPGELNRNVRRGYGDGMARAFRQAAGKACEFPIRPRAPGARSRFYGPDPLTIAPAEPDEEPEASERHTPAARCGTGNAIAENAPRSHEESGGTSGQGYAGSVATRIISPPHTGQRAPIA